MVVLEELSSALLRLSPALVTSLSANACQPEQSWAEQPPRQAVASGLVQDERHTSLLPAEKKHDGPAFTSPTRSPPCSCSVPRQSNVPILHGHSAARPGCREVPRAAPLLCADHGLGLPLP